MSYKAPLKDMLFDIQHLARIVKTSVSPTAIVYYPAMNNFGGLGINPTMFAWYSVFAVDPGNAYHLIAPDVVNEKMMAVPTVIRSRLRSTTVEPAETPPMAPPNMSERPPPRPLCKRISRISRNETMTWTTTTAAVSTIVRPRGAGSSGRTVAGIA